ncbi:MAG: TIGR02266 family protein [Deltaproteobacteria bacterium]|nr:TIGR02266 family protein [Deltaproteobacteria bacterium]MBN2673981.1 TIGR02266 family protein [Deltaproteobacteria bacterium]
MTNDERREKRVQASLKVRYKSATVTEFIEKHSHDISPGGVFIRSQKPLPKGSLLKIDFRLEDDTAVIQGVGRVVWIREADDDTSKPPGMGIKFIRLDENSKLNIHKIISVQKSGEEINRASILGDDDDEEIDTANIKLPEGKTVRDSVAPSVDVRMSDSSESSEQSNEEEDNEPTKKIDVGSKSGKDNPSKKESGESDSKAASGKDEPSEKPTAVAPEEKKGNGILVVLLLIAVAALGYFLMRPSDETTTDTDESSNVEEEAIPEDPEVADTGAAESEPAPEPEPAPEEPPAVMSGAISIAADVEGAKVKIDGAVQEGVTPLQIPAMVVGEHDLEITLFGYEPLQQKIELVEGQPLELKVELAQARQVMSLKASSGGRDIVGAKVFVGEKQIGRTPIKSVKRRDPNFEYMIRTPKYQDYPGKVTEADWVYEDGVYTLTIEAQMVEEVATPKAVPAAASEEAPVQRTRVKTRAVKPKVSTSTEGPSADGDAAAATPAKAESATDGAETKPAATPKTAPAAQTKPAEESTAPAAKPVVKAAGADENPY